MVKQFLVAASTCLLTIQSSIASVPTLAITFDTNVRTVNTTSSQEYKIRSAEEKIRKVIASEAFRSAILNFTYNGRKQFNNNNGLTNAQIYIKILEGAEKLSPTKNNRMDLNIKVYYENSSTVGYTSTGSTYINMNSKFLNQFNANSVSSNMTHEWLHKLGFSHAVSYSVSRDYSVPYAVGRIVSSLARNY